MNTINTSQFQEFQREADDLKSLWYALLPDHPIPNVQFSLWLSRYGHSISRHGIEQTALKHAKRSDMTTDHLSKFCSAVMRDYREMLEEKRGSNGSMAQSGN